MGWSHTIPEVPTESLGFLSNSLIYGHQVSGPLWLLKEKWTDNECKINLLQYVCKFRDRQRTSWAFANEHLKKAQSNLKRRYDKKATMEEFQLSDEVLVWLPLPDHPLSAELCGPYKVIWKVSQADYILNTCDRRKSQQLCHINMLKPYHRVPSPWSACFPQTTKCCVSVSFKKVELEDCPLSPGNVCLGEYIIVEKIADCICSHGKQLTQLLLQHPSVFRGTPSLTSLIEHSIDIGDALPVKLLPYRVSPVLKHTAGWDWLRAAATIDQALCGWVVYPVMIILKPGGLYHFFISYWQVNSLVKTDAYLLPRMDEYIDQVRSAKFITEIDLV